MKAEFCFHYINVHKMAVLISILEKKKNYMQIAVKISG
jgi:hypothetical protein